MKINFLGLLILLFIGLKLTEQIDWSWWWIFSPLLIPFFLISLGTFFLVFFKK